MNALQGTFVQERVYTAPRGRIHDLAMPHQCSDIVASCSHEEIRLWDTRMHTELLRIELPSIDCLCLTIPKVLPSIPIPAYNSHNPIVLENI